MLISPFSAFMQIHFLWWHHLNLKTKVKLIFIPFPWKQFWGQYKHWYQYSLVLEQNAVAIPMLMWPWGHKTWVSARQWPSRGQQVQESATFRSRSAGQTGCSHKSQSGSMKDYINHYYNLVGMTVLRNAFPVWCWAHRQVQGKMMWWSFPRDCGRRELYLLTNEN